MKIKTFSIFLMLISLLFIACDEDSPTETISSTNSLTITGDFTKSFDAICMAGIVTEDTTSFFTVIFQPKEPSSDSEMLSVVKMSYVLPAVGKYNIGTNIESGDDFFSFYSKNDSTFYVMYSGTVEITKSSSENISGKLDMQGGLFDIISSVPTRIINVKGQFSTKPMDF